MIANFVIVFLDLATVSAGASRFKCLFHLDLDDSDDVAADSNNLYFACHSAHAPGKPAANPPNMDAWVAKLDRRTGKLLYLTQLGGQGVDLADRVKVDGRGYAYVTGFTGSRDFPLALRRRRAGWIPHRIIARRQSLLWRLCRQFGASPTRRSDSRGFRSCCICRRNRHPADRKGLAAAGPEREVRHVRRGSENSKELPVKLPSRQT